MRSFGPDESPIKSPDFPERSDEQPPAYVPSRKKSQTSNGHPQNGPASNGTNGTKPEVVDVVPARRKRSADDASDVDSQLPKKPKTTNGSENVVISIDDTVDGAILIDDD